MNILIIKLSAIGDVVHTLPSLAALRRMFPHSHITWVIEEGAADLIAEHPHLNRVLVSRRKSWMRKPLQKSTFREVKEFLFTLRDRRYDTVIDFHGLFKSTIIAAASPGRRRIGYRSLQELSGLFYNERIPEDMDKHAVERYLDFIRYLGWPNPPVEFLIPSPEDVKEKARHLLASRGITPERDPFIAINPMALWPTKLWREEGFARLTEMIGERLNLPVVFTGGIEEALYIRHIASLMKHPVIDLTGKTTLRVLAEIYRHAKLLVSTDSGPMHIAAAVGTPVVALFGPTDPRRTGPYGRGHEVIRAGVPCSPCFLKSCHSRVCMTSISVEEVFSRVEKIIQRKEA